jgi:hypothetical protein
MVGRLLWPCDELVIVFVSVAVVVRALISIAGGVAAAVKADAGAVVVDEIMVAAVGSAGYKMSAAVVDDLVLVVAVMTVDGAGVVLPTIANTCNSNNRGRNTYSTCFWGKRADSLPHPACLSPDLSVVMCPKST